MSYSPPIRRLSNAGSSIRHQEELINAYEAEEERIINVLSRKLEQLRQEKIGLENVLEAESESHVNRLSRELSALRIAQQQFQQQTANGTTPSSNGSNGVFSVSPEINRNGFRSFEPSPEVMLETMQRENEQLRNRLSETERDFIRITRLNDIYREELIDHRRRAHKPHPIGFEHPAVTLTFLRIRHPVPVLAWHWSGELPERKHQHHEPALFGLVQPTKPDGRPTRERLDLPICTPAFPFFIFRLSEHLLPHPPGPVPVSHRAAESTQL
ncbi:hypothetical protein H1R20_g3919, partial [Candolleomyces eurysporus]